MVQELQDMPATGRPRPDAVMVFVGGLHRSGTTILGRRLAQHPEASGFEESGAPEDEGQHLQDVLPKAYKIGGPGRFARREGGHLTEESALATPTSAERLFRTWAPHWDLSKRLLVEKSPPNLIRTRLLQRLFPNSSFVIIVRHPIVVSYATQKWSWHPPMPTMRSLLDHWAVAHRTFLDDASHLERVRLVRYEDLVSDPGAVLAGLANFLELDSPPGGQGLARGLNGGYLARWQLLRRSLLTRRYGRNLVAEFGAQAEAFGYDLDEPVPFTPAADAVRRILIER